MVESLITTSFQLGLTILVGLLVISSYRIWVGPSQADRLQAVDSATTLLLSLIVVLALVQRDPVIIDVGLSLAAFAFVGTLAVARYLCEGKVF